MDAPKGTACFEARKLQNLHPSLLFQKTCSRLWKYRAVISWVYPRVDLKITVFIGWKKIFWNTRRIFSPKRENVASDFIFKKLARLQPQRIRIPGFWGRGARDGNNSCYGGLKCVSGAGIFLSVLSIWRFFPCSRWPAPPHVIDDNYNHLFFHNSMYGKLHFSEWFLLLSSTVFTLRSYEFFQVIVLFQLSLGLLTTQLLLHRVRIAKILISKKSVPISTEVPG